MIHIQVEVIIVHHNRDLIQVQDPSHGQDHQVTHDLENVDIDLNINIIENVEVILPDIMIMIINILADNTIVIDFPTSTLIVLILFLSFFRHAISGILSTLKNPFSAGILIAPLKTIQCYN